MWKRGWIKRGNCQTEWLNGREEGKKERSCRRKERTALQKEKQNGIAKGERAKQLEIAKNLIAKGFEKNEIAEITKLSIEEIENLIEENKLD